MKTPASSLPRVPGLFSKLGLAAFSVLLSLFLVEGGSYLFGRFEGPGNPIRGGYIQALGQHDFLLFWSLRPNFVDKQGRHWANALGLRGPAIPPKAPDEFRILSLGESTTFAPRMSYDQCYSSVLERELKKTGPGREVRVINGGVPGYTLFQGYQYLRTRGLDLDPDMVLIYFGYNDFLPVSFLGLRAGGDPGRARGLNDWELFERRQAFGERIRSFLTRHSNLFRGLVYRRQRDGGDPDGESIQIDPDRVRVPSEHREKLLEMLSDMCRERGIDLVIVIPWYLKFKKHIALLRNFAERNGVTVVDLPRILPSRLSRAKKSYFVDDIHPTPEGHRLIAEAIYEIIVEEGHWPGSSLQGQPAEGAGRSASGLKARRAGASQALLARPRLEGL